MFKQLKKFAFSILVSTYAFYGHAQAQQVHQLRGNIQSAKQRVEGASVQLLRAKDSSLIKAELSNVLGEFSFERINDGNYLLKISHVGFVTVYTSPFNLTADKDLGQIQLQPKAHELKEVSVVAKKPFVEQQQGKTVLNVENSITAAGSTALEVLQKAPGITLDQNDNIKMRGKQGVFVMIDGKRVPLSGEELATMLKGMPANSIEKIDLISNPSSKYDASGNAGIIDIKLKRNKQSGANGNVTASYGWGRLWKGNTGITFNQRTKTYNLSTSYNYTRRSDINDLQIYREFLNGTQLTGGFNQDNKLNSYVNAHLARASADFFLSSKTTVGLSASGYLSDISRGGEVKSTAFNNQRLNSSYSTTATTASRDRSNPSFNVNLRQKLDTLGKELSVDADYARYNTGDVQNYITSYFNLNGSQARVPYVLYGDLNGKLNIKSVKADYTQPFKRKTAKLEAGVKSSWVDSDDDLVFVDKSNGGYVIDATKTNHFIYNENINAAYANFSDSWKKFELQVGLRLENTNVKGTQVTDNNSFKRNYTQLFPSAYGGFKITDKHEIGLSLSRRIDRPNYRQLNPFIFYINESTYASGNPYLKPQLTYSVEAVHTFDQRFITKIGYSRTTDFILNILAPDPSMPNVVVETDRNLASLDYYSISVSVPLEIGKWLSSSNNFLVYYGRYSGNLANTNLDKGRPAFNINTSNNITFSPTWSAEVTGSYQSSEIYGFIDSRPIWFISAGVQKQLWNKKANIKLNVADIFYTNGVTATTRTNGYFERFKQRRDSRVATLSLTYRFGKGSGGAPKRKSGAEEEKNRAN